MKPSVAMPPHIQAAPAQTIEATGPAVIVDGDTMWIGQEEARVYGVDAPETAQKVPTPRGDLGLL